MKWRIASRPFLRLPLALLAAGLLSGPVAGAENVELAAVYPMSGPTTGVASWYGGIHAGRPTANGEIHRTTSRTAAHRNLPFGTLIEVTNLANGRTAVVCVNDRGPYVEGRILDLSEAAARELAMQNAGLAHVRLRPLARRPGPVRQSSLCGD